MWQISSITCPDATGGLIFGGIGNNMIDRSVGQSLPDGGAMYVVQFEGHGAVTLTATNSPGPGGIGTIIVNNNTELSISYYQNGNLGLRVDENNNVTITGGTPTVATTTLSSMIDMDALVSYMSTMALQSSVLQTQWNSSIISTLQTMGFPMSAVSNLDPNALSIYFSTLQGIVFPSGAEMLPGEAYLVLEMHRTKNYDAFSNLHPRFQSWKCTGCKLGVMAVTAAILAAIGIAIVAALPGTSVATALATMSITAAAAQNTGLGIAVVARIVGAAVGASGVVGVIFNEVVEGLCVAMGACNPS